MSLQRGLGVLAASLALAFATSAAADNVYAIGPSSVSPYTDLSQLSDTGRIQQYGAVGYSIGGGLAPLTTGLTSIAFDHAQLYSVGANSGYTYLYQLSDTGLIQQYGAVGYSVGGGLAPLTTGLNAIAFDNPTAAVPEPTAWALIIVGLGLTGAALRRRRAVVAA